MSYHLNKYLTRKKETAVVDRLMGLAAIIHPLMGTPQIYKIYSTRDAIGVSLITWLGFMVLGLIFLAYGLVHRIKPFILTQLLWFVVDFLVVAGIVLYN
jgi:uncharacterized protein with PQ loop repeat